MIRKAKVNGTFYPGDAKTLRKTIRTFLEQVTTKQKYQNILGVIAPHAGYLYSGQCAAYSYSALSKENFKKVVIIAPSHRFGNFQFSVGNFSHYETPLGTVAVDQDICSKLLQNDGFEFAPAAHNSEHSLEVQIPFLQFINPKATIIPILVGRQNPESSHYLAKVLNAVLDKQKDSLRFVISSDLSHYYSSELAEEKDEKLAQFVRAQDINSLVSAIRQREVEACGFGGIITLMDLAKRWNYTGSELLHYTHSGMISGDMTQVVGYLSALYHKII